MTEWELIKKPTGKWIVKGNGSYIFDNKHDAQRLHNLLKDYENHINNITNHEQLHEIEAKILTANMTLQILNQEFNNLKETIHKGG